MLKLGKLKFVKKIAKIQIKASLQKNIFNVRPCSSKIFELRMGNM